MTLWKGWGILLAVLALATLVLMEVATESWFGDAAYYQEHTWPMAAAFLITAAAVWPLGQWLNGRGRTLVDPETGEEVRVGGDHSFFFIKLQYWAPILVMVGVGALFV